MVLHLLPERTGGAAENMALDFLLLQRYPHVTPRFRHYGWSGPSFTFGLSQKLEFVRSQLPAGETFDLCRRPTGGGVVDHREDWTYTLVIPRGHPLEELRATQSYRVVHEALADAMRTQGVAAATKQHEIEVEVGELNAFSAGPAPWRQVAPPARVTPPAQAASPAQVAQPVQGVASGQVTPPSGPAGVCFQRAEIYDVVNESNGEKIAGAAQKRNKNGLLLQGSIWCPAAGSSVDWQKFRDDFVAGLAKALAVPAAEVPWPDLNEEEVSGLTERYSSPEWMESR